MWRTSHLDADQLSDTFHLLRRIVARPVLDRDTAERGLAIYRVLEGRPDLLSPAPAFLADQPVVGLWPAGAVEAIEAILTGDGRHSMLQFAEAIGARAVKTGSGSDNINTQADLAALEKRHGL